MNPRVILLLVVLLYPVGVDGGEAEESKGKDLIEVRPPTNSQEPIGKLGLTATYRHESGGLIPRSIVQTFMLALGPLEEKNSSHFQWLHLQATKTNGERFSVWILTSRYPPASLTAAQKTTARYILQEGNSKPLEFRHQFSGEAVLPSLGAWKHLFPRAADGSSSDDLFPRKIHILGNVYLLERIEDSKK